MTWITADADSKVDADIGAWVARALALATSLLLTLGPSFPASAASSDSSVLTEPGAELLSSSTALSSGVERAALAAAVDELSRAKRAVAALQADLSTPSTQYLIQLAAVLERVSDRPTAGEVRGLAVGLRQAWVLLVQSARNTTTWPVVRGIEPGLTGPDAPRTDPLSMLAAHPSRPKLREPQLLARAFAQHPELAGLAVEAMNAARAVFGAGGTSTLAFEPFVDPESPSETLRVYLVVVTSLDVEAADERISEFEVRWLLDNCHRADGLLSVSVDYV
jgi:hypothetical protein